MKIGLSFSPKVATKSWIQYQQPSKKHLRRIFVATLWSWAWQSHLMTKFCDQLREALGQVPRSSMTFLTLTQHLCVVSGIMWSRIFSYPTSILINTECGDHSSIIHLLKKLILKNYQYLSNIGLLLSIWANNEFILYIHFKKARLEINNNTHDTLTQYTLKNLSS